MPPGLRTVAARIGWQLRSLPRRAKNDQPVVLLYHGVRSEVDASGFGVREFEAHIRFLKENFDIVSPEAVISGRRGNGRIRVLLSFDDGFRNNVETAAPILIKYEAPAVFFISTRHITPGRYLWFAHLRALEEVFEEKELWFQGQRFEMRGPGRALSLMLLQQQLLALRPHPSAMYAALEKEFPSPEYFVSAAHRADRYEGMSPEQLEWLASNPLFTMGGHTIDHPFLTRSDPSEAMRQMWEGKLQIERITGKPCDLFSYPGVDYDDYIVEACRKCGFLSAFSAEKQMYGGHEFELPRTGIYYPPLTELGFKVRWSGALRRVQQWQMNWR